MSILALDLGTKTGWASSDGESGVWEFKASKFDSPGWRYKDFYDKLIFTLNMYEVNLVVYEEVRKHFAVDAAHVYGGLTALLQVICLDSGRAFRGVPVGTIKKHATGKGNAKKEDMIRSANNLYPKINIIDDNHADALCLLHYADQEFNIN